MIKFFRKIRRNLLSEGKTVKYLKYAIGEIVLVVIGILIALSINNWNQNRLLKEQSHQVLLNLQKEILKKKAELENAIEFIQQRLDMRLDYLNDDALNLSDSEKIKKLSNVITFYTKPILIPIVESELGPDKKIFQWPELTEKMQNLSESVAFYNKGLDYLDNDMFSNVWPYLVKEGVIIDILVYSEMLKSDNYLHVDKYNDENFRNVIAASTLMIPALFEGAKEIMEDYDELLRVINEKVE